MIGKINAFLKAIAARIGRSGIVSFVVAFSATSLHPLLLQEATKSPTGQIYVGLNDGQIIEGFQKARQEGKFITMKVDGIDRTIPWAQISDIHDRSFSGKIRVNLVDGSSFDGVPYEIKIEKFIILYLDYVGGPKHTITWAKISNITDAGPHSSSGSRSSGIPWFWEMQLYGSAAIESSNLDTENTALSTIKSAGGTATPIDYKSHFSGGGQVGIGFGPAHFSDDVVDGKGFVWVLHLGFTRLASEKYTFVTNSSINRTIELLNMPFYGGITWGYDWKYVRWDLFEVSATLAPAAFNYVKISNGTTGNRIGIGEFEPWGWRYATSIHIGWANFKFLNRLEFFGLANEFNMIRYTFGISVFFYKH